MADCIWLYLTQLIGKIKYFYCNVRSYFFFSLYGVNIVIGALREIFFQKWFYSKNYGQLLHCDVWVGGSIWVSRNSWDVPWGESCTIPWQRGQHDVLVDWLSPSEVACKSTYVALIWFTGISGVFNWWQENFHPYSFPYKQNWLPTRQRITVLC